MPAAENRACRCAAFLFLPAAHAERDHLHHHRQFVRREGYVRKYLRRASTSSSSCGEGLRRPAAQLLPEGYPVRCAHHPGHFNAGERSTRTTSPGRSLRVDELERVVQQQLPGAVRGWKEVYLFGCEFNPDDRATSAYGERARRMRRLFGNVPDHGFGGRRWVPPVLLSILPPAAARKSGPSQSRLLRQFSFNHMVLVAGIRDSSRARIATGVPVLRRALFGAKKPGSSRTRW